ncbi:hypothetical protein [Methylobacterium gregans]|uniref:hypothetical protein n=1 Tax=Methylobacterium gregans TaxID=374424 RepID=UPI001EE16024|nr:hypothetical protein [Methylobacterium gregans]
MTGRDQGAAREQGEEGGFEGQAHGRTAAYDINPAAANGSEELIDHQKICRCGLTNGKIEIVPSPEFHEN